MSDSTETINSRDVIEESDRTTVYRINKAIVRFTLRYTPIKNDPNRGRYMKFLRLATKLEGYFYKLGDIQLGELGSAVLNFPNGGIQHSYVELSGFFQNIAVIEPVYTYVTGDSIEYRRPEVDKIKYQFSNEETTLTKN